MEYSQDKSRTGWTGRDKNDVKKRRAAKVVTKLETKLKPKLNTRF